MTRGGRQRQGASRARQVFDCTQGILYVAWGLFDMHGNTYEWTRDWFHSDLPGGADPDLHDDEATATQSEQGVTSRVRRSGGWGDPGWSCRSAFRLRFEPERRYDHIGFRLAVVRP